MDLNSVVDCFLEEKHLEIQPVTNGHINHTYIVTAPGGERYILQKINNKVFKQPEVIADNHLKVNELLTSGNYARHILEPKLTKKGNYFDESENRWRMLKFIEGSNTYLKVPSPAIARKATEALSEFYAILNASPGQRMKDPLPGFIDFKSRMEQFAAAIRGARPELLSQATEEISFIRQHENLPAQWLKAHDHGEIPIRIIHADPKISNLLFSNDGEVLAVIDLDTVMNGTILYDFGDMVRSYTNLSEEDDGSTVDNFSAEIYQEVKNGFLSRLSGILTEKETRMLDYAAQVVIYIQAVRFLADYLNGSIYYSTSYPEHNLDRTRNQIHLLKGLMAFQADTVA